MGIRRTAASLPLLCALACGGPAMDEGTGEPEQDVLLDSSEQDLHWRRSYSQWLYDAFTGSYDVATFSGTVARAGGIPGAPVDADFYYPDGCSRDANWWNRWKCFRKSRRTGNVDAFPMVPILPGGNVPRGQYSEFARELASYGYVVVVTDLKQSFGPPGSPELLLTSQWVPNWVEADLAQRDADPGSPLHQIVNTSSMGVIGHSFGAAATLATVQGTCEPPFCFGPPNAYQRPASVKAAVIHGFQNCDPSGMSCFYPDTSAAPVMLVNGSLDDPGAPTDEAYESLEPTRGLVVLEDVNHFGLTNDDLASPFGPNPEPNELDQGLSNSRTARWTAAWLGTHLSRNRLARKLVFRTSEVEGATITTER